MASIIFLLGFMGSGKTKTGSRAAKLLDYDFIDLDKYLEKKEGRSISQIFEEEGETYFRQKENEYLRKLTTSLLTPDETAKSNAAKNSPLPGRGAGGEDLTKSKLTDSPRRVTLAELGDSAATSAQPQKGSKPFRGSPTIIAVGGGTPCFNNNMNWMLQHGKCIWLKVSEEELFQRLKDKRKKRPLLRNLTDEGLKEFIKKRVEEREKYYSQAHLIIKADGLKVKELVEKITA